MTEKRLKTLIVDDSAVVRQVLTEILGSDPDIEVIGAVANPFLAVDRMAENAPDVIVLDIEMPRMDGLTFLKKIMTQHPIPVVICSSLAGPGEETTFRALELGAVDIITKPQVGTREFLAESKIRVCDAVKAAAKAKIGKIIPRERLVKHTADVILPAKKVALTKTTDRVVVIGASTGGTEALKELITNLPLDCPGVAIVQHMPEHFTASFARRLNDLSCVTVKEAENGDSMLRGQVLIAPGNKHMLLKLSGARYFVEIRDGPLVSRHRPSVDVLFRSSARYAGKNAVGVILTGMGDDGARGLLEMREAGARTIAQDEKTSVVFGMPNEAIKLDAAEFVLPLNQINQKVIRLCQD